MNTVSPTGALGASAVGAAPVDRIRQQTTIFRWCGLVALSALLVGWHARATGSADPTSWAFLVAVVLVTASYGRLVTRWTAGFVNPPGLPFVVVTGFFAANTLLFVFALVSPLGMVVDAALVALVAVVIAPFGRWPEAGARSLRATEAAGLACIVFCGVAATLWVNDQQPILVTSGDRAVFRVWHDVFIHVREISTFAQSHGFWTISDMRMAGAPAPIYHFASYMVPAALNAATATTAMQSYGGFQLPFGLILAALAAYVFAHVLFGSAGPALAAAIALAAVPDAYQQGFGIRFLSYHFMTQVNLGMLYGIACIVLAWIFMVEACRRGRRAGIAIAWFLLAVCLGYKAHVFVANALLLLLYPCVFYRGLDRRRRLVLAGLAVIVFYAVVTVSQLSPRVPTLRVDGSGIEHYFQILRWTFDPGPYRWVFDRLYYRPLTPLVAKAMLVVVMLLLSSFGYWLLAAPLLLRSTRARPERLVVGLGVLVLVNYMAMSLLLALDDTGVSGPEEFVNRPHAWAYFVIVSLVAGSAWRFFAAKPFVRTAFAPWAAAAGAALLLVFVAFSSRDLQTIPAWEHAATYDRNNGMDACLVAATRYIREHGAVGDVMQDSRFDERFIATALAERQIHAARSTFAGRTPRLDARVDALTGIQRVGDAEALRRYATENRIAWYLLEPRDSSTFQTSFLATATFECSGYRVFRLTP